MDSELDKKSQQELLCFAFQQHEKISHLEETLSQKETELSDKDASILELKKYIDCLTEQIKLNGYKRFAP